MGFFALIQENEFSSILIKIIYAPLVFPTILAIVLPMILAIAVMEFYFQRYPRETVGHHKAMENTIFLFFVVFNLIYHLINHFTIPKLIVVVIFMIFTIVVTILDFLHKLPLNLIFKTPAKMFIMIFTYISIVLVHSDILNKIYFLKIIYIIIATIILIVIIILIKSMFSALEPKSYEEIENLLKSVEEDLKKAHKKNLK